MPTRPTKSKRKKDDYNGYMRAYMARRYETRMAEFRERLGGKCERCGSTEDLEFDHIDRTTKIGIIGKIWNRRKDIVEAELKKCQLLCAECHLEKSRECGDMLPAAQHGSITMYVNHRCRCEPCRACMREYRKRTPRGR